MKAFTAQVFVRLKPGILDPQGQAIEHALHALGFDSIQHVHTGKFFELEIRAGSKKQAEEIARRSCDKLLANPVIESYTLNVVENRRDGSS